MSQTKSMSLLEAVVNTVLGLVVAMFATAAICKAYSIPMSWENNFIITFWMTVISIVRSYLLRRLFNGDWKAGVVRFLDRASCWYGHSGRGAPILHSPPPCAGCSKCVAEEQLRNKFNEESV